MSIYLYISGDQPTSNWGTPPAFVDSWSSPANLTVRSPRGIPHGRMVHPSSLGWFHWYSVISPPKKWSIWNVTLVYHFMSALTSRKIENGIFSVVLGSARYVWSPGPTVWVLLWACAEHPCRPGVRECSLPRQRPFSRNWVVKKLSCSYGNHLYSCRLRRIIFNNLSSSI